MTKIRVSALAKELGIKSGLIIEKCKELGLSYVTHHANTIEEKDVENVRNLFRPKETPPTPVPPTEKQEKEVLEARIPTPPLRPTAAPPTAPLPPKERPKIEPGEVIPGEISLKPVPSGKFIKVSRHPTLRRPAGPAFVPHWRRARRVPKEVAPAALKVVPRGQKVTLETPITVKDLSSKLGIKASNIITKLLMEHNIGATMNQSLDEETVALLALDFGIEVECKKAKRPEEELKVELAVPSRTADLVARPPIVTFMGHVDHGKTSLLDAIRKTNVAGGEVGGITQHIGAYRVETNGRSVVFLDTPGHEAFTAMRARGSQATDVAVLVVAADDGVMPQTEEALNHAKAAGVPVVVAINKIDKPEANPMRVKQQLSKLGLVPEEWGGKTGFVETSATTKKGLDELLERLLLEAEILELKANPKGTARGVVLEARLHEGRGVVATVIVQDGTLHLGDPLLCGQASGRVRAMYNDRGQAVTEAGPSYPVSVSDLSTIPEAGEKFYVLKDMQRAKGIALDRQKQLREAGLKERGHVSLENLYTKIEAGKVKELKLILKADVKGSLEVLENMLEELSTGEVKVRILHSGIGSITESDVILADASDAIIIGFYVALEEGVAGLAEGRGVEIRHYQVIYDITRDVKAAMEGLLEPEKKEVVTGQVEIKQVFKISRFGNVAGCVVKSGKINRNSIIRVTRDGAVLFEGKLASLKIVKEDVKEVRQGLECGIKIAGFDDIKVGDTVEAYEIQQIARTLS
ncbi:MAG TPA: translation initiation factor IF-2 [Candidatus Tripitaka californicus]|uniref:translation initiation factor IF-2 n=2 Tax=Candidatus Tripitaka californicus TaxID=3367616 RepID=UPI00402A1B46|nr:translation initiation factor IF-2 [Planctomycetota bacterium]